MHWFYWAHVHQERTWKFTNVSLHKKSQASKRVKVIISRPEALHTKRIWYENTNIKNQPKICRDSNIVKVTKELVHPPENKTKEEVTTVTHIPTDTDE